MIKCEFDDLKVGDFYYHQVEGSMLRIKAQTQKDKENSYSIFNEGFPILQHNSYKHGPYFKLSLNEFLLACKDVGRGPQQPLTTFRELGLGSYFQVQKNPSIYRKVSNNLDNSNPNSEDNSLVIYGGTGIHHRGAVYFYREATVRPMTLDDIYWALTPKVGQTDTIPSAQAKQVATVGFFRSFARILG